jgi:hypothetical protein
MPKEQPVYTAVPSFVRRSYCGDYGIGAGLCRLISGDEGRILPLRLGATLIGVRRAAAARYPFR